MLEEQEIPSQEQEMVMLEIPITPRAVSLMKAYAAFTGESASKVSEVLGASVGQIIEAKLWDLAKEAMGGRPGQPEMPVGTQQAFIEDNRLADLGDADNDDDDGGMIPKQNWSTETFAPEATPIESFEATPPSVSSGMSDEDLDNDLFVQDPNHEAASDALPEEITDEAGMMRALGLINAYVAKQGQVAVSIPKKLQGKNLKVTAKAAVVPAKPRAMDSRALKRQKKLTGFKGKVQKFDGNETSAAAELG